MHSSRMRTARSSSHHGESPHPPWSRHSLGCGPGDPPRCGPGDPLLHPKLDPPQLPPWVWAWRSPWPDPPQLPPWVWAWRPPWPDPLNFPLGVRLETCKACWDTTPLETCCKAHWDTTSPPPPHPRQDS